MAEVHHFICDKCGAKISADRRAPKIVCDKLFGGDFDYADEDLIMTMEDFRNRYIKPAIEYELEMGLGWWPIETISKSEFHRRYPDAGR